MKRFFRILRRYQQGFRGFCIGAFAMMLLFMILLVFEDREPEAVEVVKEVGIDDFDMHLFEKHMNMINETASLLFDINEMLLLSQRNQSELLATSLHLIEKNYLITIANTLQLIYKINDLKYEINDEIKPEFKIPFDIPYFQPRSDI